MTSISVYAALIAIFAAILVAFVSAEEPKCPEVNGDDATLLPNPDDCSTFYECDEGKPFLLECSPGLEYNPELRVCDYPNPNATCKHRPDLDPNNPNNRPSSQPPQPQHHPSSSPKPKPPRPTPPRPTPRPTSKPPKPCRQPKPRPPCKPKKPCKKPSYALPQFYPSPYFSPILPREYYENYYENEEYENEEYENEEYNYDSDEE